MKVLTHFERVPTDSVLVLWVYNHYDILKQSFGCIEKSTQIPE